MYVKEGEDVISGMFTCSVLYVVYVMRINT